MEQETKLYIDKVACIARSNMCYQQQTPQDSRTLDNQGMSLIMSGFLEMYDIFVSDIPNQSPPSPKIYTIASSCCEMKNKMMRAPRETWDPEEEGFFKLMTAYMFLFKHLYVPAH